MREIKLTLPITEEQVRALKVGDMVLLSGVLYTGRDAVHKHLYEGKSIPVDIRGSAIYHCGPVVVKQESGEWSVRAAGPTTSTREEPYQATVIEKYGIRAVIGKGGMGPKTLKACQDFGCVYLHAVGGAAQVLAEKVKKVRGVSMLEEFGSPEAIWELEVVDFPALVTIDAHGNSLHAEVAAASEQRLAEVIGTPKSK
ncbi:MAG: L(+)-tartrate dehydratase subunit beta [Pseudomonadota bacterium]|jgi:fumarate hydratase class I